MPKAHSSPIPLSEVMDAPGPDPTVIRPPVTMRPGGGARNNATWQEFDASYDVSDAYCRLAAQLHQVQQTRPLTTLLIASALPAEGKSLTAANLARALSEAYGKRVVLIDADLRRPSLHTLFGTRSSPGLKDCLAGNSPLHAARLSSTLSLVPAGTPEPNPLERLSSGGLRTLLLEQAQRADWVIIDAPPLAACPDAGLLAGMVDGVVVVVRAGQTQLAAVESAIAALGRERIVGVVLNRSTSNTTRYRYPARKA
jgi:capsular exopolysaccharide synthesis family protein